MMISLGGLIFWSLLATLLLPIALLSRAISPRLAKLSAATVGFSPRLFEILQVSLLLLNPPSKRSSAQSWIDNS